jgi:hypothetical protein
VAALETRVSQMLADPSTLKGMSAAAVAFSADKNGAADRTFVGLLPLLGPPA